jgi:AcrR family transcriptional regulator
MRDQDRTPDRPEDMGEGKPSGPESPQDASALSRKDRERAMHRDQILSVAMDLLGRKQYTEITVQEIAANAEFSVGYIYKIFDSKEDIYVTLIKEQSDHLLGIVERATKGSESFEERLGKMVHGVLSWLDSSPFTATHLNETHGILHTLPRLPAVHVEREERLTEVGSAFLREGIAEEAIQGDLDIMMKTLRALIWGFIGEDMIHGTKSRNWADYAPIVVQVFMKAFAPEGGAR